jgi:hypothetical protein
MIRVKLLNTSQVQLLLFVCTKMFSLYSSRTDFRPSSSITLSNIAPLRFRSLDRSECLSRYCEHDQTFTRHSITTFHHFPLPQKQF